jgi:hypothetical protein
MRVIRSFFRPVIEGALGRKARREAAGNDDDHQQTSRLVDRLVEATDGALFREGYDPI